MTPDKAALLAKEKQSRQRYDRAMAALRAQSQDESGAAVPAEVDEAKREWEAARKRLELFQAERSSD